MTFSSQMVVSMEMANDNLVHLFHSLVLAMGSQIWVLGNQVQSDNQALLADSVLGRVHWW